MDLNEKVLPVYRELNRAIATHTRKYYLIALVVAIGLLLYLDNFTKTVSDNEHLSSYVNPFYFKDEPHNPDSLCPLVDKFDPLKYLYQNDTLNTILHDLKFRNESIKKLSDSIKIPTVIYENMINPSSAKSKEELYKLEPKWKSFEQFGQFLKDTFPKIHDKLKVKTVNKFSLVYTWEGSSNKKPILLTAHMDVVPIQKETLNQWSYGPFDGKFDGRFLYGRGSSDCKNLLIGLLETIELMLNEGTFDPERTIILAFGYDEEANGTGAEEISKFLNKRYGPDSMYAIIDWGNQAYETIEGRKFILPATGEKGHLDSIIDLYTPGGHSSIPPDHTLIGILAKLIDKIEEEQFSSIITNINPVLNQLQCAAEHSKSIDQTLRRNIMKAHIDQNANREIIKYLSKDLSSKYLITTSQAVDIVNGGVKSNALPEHASILVNHRIALEESVQSTSDKILSQVKDVAKSFNLGLTFDGEVLEEHTSNGYFNYSLSGQLEPAPITPINNKIWNTYGGSLRYLYENLIDSGGGEEYIVSPFISTGNTDTKSYWDLSRNIFRYAPGIPTVDNINSIDEKLDFDGHLYIIAFYYYYLQVVDKLNDDLL